MSTVPGGHGVIGLRVPGAIAFRHVAIRVVTTACKMALDARAASRASDASGQDGRGPDDFESEVVSAFGEAFNNIAVHGFKGATPEPVQIEVDWDDERIVITFVDTGRTFDPETAAPPDLDTLPEHGMGLFIIKSCMDEVDYRPGPPNVLRLLKRHGGSSAKTSAGDVAPPARPPPSGAGPEDPGEGDRGSGVEFIAPQGESCIVAGAMGRADDRVAESSRRR